MLTVKEDKERVLKKVFGVLELDCKAGRITLFEYGRIGNHILSFGDKSAGVSCLLVGQV